MPYKNEKNSKKVHIKINGTNRAGYMTTNKRTYDDGTISTDTLYHIYPNLFEKGKSTNISGGAKTYKVLPSGEERIDYFRPNLYEGKVTYDDEHPWYENYPRIKLLAEFLKSFGK